MGNEDTVSKFESFQAQGIGQMCFAHSGLAHQDDVVGGGYKAASTQLEDLPPVQFWLKAEIVAVQGL